MAKPDRSQFSWMAATWLAIVTAAFVGVMVAILTGFAQASRSRTAESAANIARAGIIQRDLLDMETGQRGFFLTGDSSYLEPYRRASAELEQALEQFRERGANSRELTEAMRAMSRAKADELHATLELNRTSHAGAVQLIRTDAGKRSMDSVRRMVATVESVEGGRQRQRAERERLWARIVWGALALGTLLTVVVLLHLRASLTRYEIDRRAAIVEMEKQLKAIEAQERSLAGRIPRPSDELRA